MANRQTLDFMANDLPTLLEQLRTGAAPAKHQAAFALGQMRNPVIIPDLLQAADTEDETLIILLASALAALGDDSTEQLQAALAHESVAVRRTVIAALGQKHTSHITQLLISLLSDDHSTIQQAAANALRHHNTPEAQQALKIWDVNRNR